VVVDPPAPHWSYTVHVDGRTVVDSADSSRPGPRRRLRNWGPVVVATVVTAAAVVVIVEAWDSFDGPVWLAVPLQLVGLPYVLGGAALWIHRPGNYLGPVCLLLGATWYLGDLQAFDQEVLFVVGFACYHLNVVVFAHLALMVPSGRLVGRLDRFVVTALYVVVPTTQLLRYLEVRPLIDRTAFGDVTAYYSGWARVGTIVGAPLAVTAAVLVLVHFRRAKEVERRPFSSFWIAAAAVGLCAAAAAALEAAPALLQQVALLGYCIALVAAAVGLVVGAINVAAPNFDAWQELSADVTDLQSAIATAVGDPDLRFYLRTNQAWRSGDGGLDAEPSPGPHLARTNLSVDGRPAARIVHDRELAYQRPLIQAVAAMTLAAMARMRLSQERHDAAVDAQHLERSRIGRDLHDGVQAILGAVTRGINGSADRLPVGHPEHDELERLAGNVTEVQGLLRRIVHDLYPRGIREDGLAGAVAALLATIGPDRLGVEVLDDIEVSSTGSQAGERVELEAYFIISEALQNAIEHSRGTRVWITAVEVDGALRIDVDDDGRGWAVNDRDTGGHGMANMAARVAVLGGCLSTGPSARGGAHVRAELPLPAPDGTATRDAG
jgi:signal transduction histidine kinase